PPGSGGLGSRDELPVVKRRAPPSARRTLGPPCGRRKLTGPGWALRVPLARFAASGSTEVDPLIEMVVLAAAVEAGMATASAVTASTSGRRCFMERELLLRDWDPATIAPRGPQLVKHAYPSGEDQSLHPRLGTE